MSYVETVTPEYNFNEHREAINAWLENGYYQGTENRFHDELDEGDDRTITFRIDRQKGYGTWGLVVELTDDDGESEVFTYMEDSDLYSFINEVDEEHFQETVYVCEECGETYDNEDDAADCCDYGDDEEDDNDDDGWDEEDE